MHALELILTVLAVTSLVAGVVVARGGVRGVGAAIGAVLEAIGATVVFFAANVGLGAALVLGARRLGIFYEALYAVNDLSLLVVSLLQALAITAWRLRAR